MYHCFSQHCRVALATCGALFTLTVATPGAAQVTYDFEDDSFLDSSVVDGDTYFFTTSADFALSGNRSLKFDDPGPEPYENFTYDVPMDDFTSGVISVWFYDTRGGFNTGHGTPLSGGSIILEDKNNPQDFVAIEVLSFPYGKGGAPAYYATEGTVDRLKPNDRFDIANLASRTVGLHKVEFHVSATDTRIFVDGTTSLEVAGPGSTATLRLRFMADSPSNWGSAENWIIAPNSESYALGEEWIYFDDISFDRELPSVETATQGFEIVDGTAEYDTAGEPTSPGGPGTPPNDNPYMNGFVNQWSVSTTASLAHSGFGSAYFANAVPPLKSVTFDLAGVTAGTSATLYFYDALGQNVDFDKNNSIILENADNPAEFIAVEILNWPYPYTAQDKTYYCTEGIADNPAFGMFWSGCFPTRSIGWHKVEIGFYDTYSLVAVDDALGHRNDTSNIVRGPGVNKNLRLRLMADGATQGGSSNWTAVTPLTALYQVSNEPYVYYDDITLPIPPTAAVSDWQMY